MKKTILTTAFILAFLISCNDTKHKNEKSKTEETTEAVQEYNTSITLSNQEEKAKETHSINNAWVREIKLDDGNKWQANIETNEGVNKMLNLVKSSEIKSVEDYHTLASKLNVEKNFVVKKCTMEGPSHDNLHVFLHPLIEKIETLGKVSTVDEGSEVKAGIKENLKEYYNYFQ